MSGGESEVTFELSKKNNEVLMVVTHRRLRNREELVGVSAGWHARWTSQQHSQWKGVQSSFLVHLREVGGRIRQETSG
jgi:hypothetical protein